MKLNSTLLSVFCMISFISTYAQDKFFSYSDYMNRDLYPESIQNLNWRGDTDSFTYIENNALLQKNAAQPERVDTLLKLETLKTKYADLEDLRRMPGINWVDDQQFYFRNDQKVFVFLSLSGCHNLI